MKTTQIIEVFKRIEELENHEFQINEQYINKTKFQIETESGFANVVSMIKKEDVGVRIETKQHEILTSQKHKIMTTDGLVNVTDLSVGTVLKNKHGDEPVVGLFDTGTVYVYDLTIDTPDHLYVDSNGFVHHNTYHISEGPRSLPTLLGPEGNKWTYHSGTKASPLSFYKTLFQERDKIIVFDEADAILKNSEIVMMLKPILDTSGDNLAEYLTGTRNMVGKSKDEIDEYARQVTMALDQGATLVRQKSKRLYDPFFDSLEDGEALGDVDVMLPSKFKFTGGMIFISNMKATEIEQAIMSRSIFIDVYLAERDVHKRIESIGMAQAKNSSWFTEEDVDEVLDVFSEGTDFGDGEEITYMTPEYARKSKQLTVRALQLGLLLKKSGLARWKELAAMYA